MSLRRRLLAGCLAVVAVLLVADVVLAATFRSFLYDRLDDDLVDAAAPILAESRFRDGHVRAGPGRPRRGPSAGQGAPGSGPSAAGDERFFSEFFVGVYAPDGTLVDRASPGLRPGDPSPPRLPAAALAARTTRRGRALEPFTASATNGSGSWRVVAVARRDGDVTVVAADQAATGDTLRRMYLVQVIATVGVLAALGAMALWVLRQGVRPLSRMAETAGAIAAGDLSRRVDVTGERTEAGQLGSALNVMLEQIEDAFAARGESEARLRQFVADASHELRTPLTSIRGYAELWRKGGLRDEGDLGEAMRRMESEARRMGVLVEDLLLLARLDSRVGNTADPGRRPLELAPVRLDHLVGDAVADARAVEPERPIELDSEPVAVLGDEARLSQVMVNLLANARVHTPPGTAVRVSLRSEWGQARLVVADDGPGMAPEVAGRVFERFYRSDASRTRASGGSGLGLAIVAAVAAAHGGGASVESAPGAGARFTVLLPLAPSS